jgi:hypothetical protein
MSQKLGYKLIGINKILVSSTLLREITRTWMIKTIQTYDDSMTEIAIVTRTSHTDNGFGLVMLLWVVFYWHSSTGGGH